MTERRVDGASLYLLPLSIGGAGGAPVCALFLPCDRNPYLELGVVRIGILVYLDIRCVSIFISGTRQPFGDDPLLQLLYGTVGP